MSTKDQTKRSNEDFEKAAKQLQAKNEGIVEGGNCSTDSDGDSFTEEDWETYTQSVNRSDGFDVEIPPNLFVMDGIYPVNLESNKAEYELWAKYAIEEYNNRENKSFEFVRVIKVNKEYATGTFYYLTLLVKDKEANDAAMDDLICLARARAKVWNGFWGDKSLESFTIVAEEN